MARPELKQFGELEPEDFERFPVWIGCHTADYGKPWYEDTDEETFRPWTGKLPADPSDGMLLVRATIELHHGSRYPGFVTPAAADWDKGPGGGPAFQHDHILGTQQPQIFVGDRRFGFWGGMIGIPIQTQQELYSALEKGPDSIFPLGFDADAHEPTGITAGQIDGFYRSTQDGIEVNAAARVEEDEQVGVAFFQMSAKAWQGWPQPGGFRNFIMRYKKVVYSSVCTRCGIYARQVAPFRFSKSAQKELPGFMQFDSVSDAFFLRPDIARELEKAGISGVSFGPALDHRTGTELGDRLQMLFPAILACAERSQLSTVTCRPDNEEKLAVQSLIPKEEPFADQQRNSVLSPALLEKIRKEGEKFRALPYCGRVKYHAPTQLDLKPGNLTQAPDLFQTEEWFGTGALAFRLTIASKRFVDLVQERRWKGLVFKSIKQTGL